MSPNHSIAGQAHLWQEGLRGYANLSQGLDRPIIPQEGLKMKSIFEQNGGTYTQVGDYLIPDISLPDAPAYPIGKYGRMRKAYATIDTSKVESFSIGKLKKTSTGRRLPIDDLSLFSILYALFRFRYSTLRWQSAPAPYGGMCCSLEQANPWGCPLQQSFHRTAQQSCLRH